MGGMTAHSFDLTAAHWLPPRDPPFVALADCETDVTGGQHDYRAYFCMTGADADCALLVGLVRYGDDRAFDQDTALYAFGLAQVLRWESRCPAWGDGDLAAQGGYDDARKAGI